MPRVLGRLRERDLQISPPIQLVQQRGLCGDDCVGYPQHPRLHTQHVLRSRQEEEGWIRFDDAPGVWLFARELHRDTFGLLGRFRVPPGRLPRFVRLLRWRRASEDAHDHEAEAEAEAEASRGSLGRASPSLPCARPLTAYPVPDLPA